MRALRSQAARSKVRAKEIRQVIKDALYPLPDYAWVNDYTRNSSITPNENDLACESNKGGVKFQEEYDELYQSHLSALETVNKLQMTIRNLLEKASFQSHQYQRTSKSNRS